MNEFQGMDPVLAKEVMAAIQSLKSSLATETSAAGEEITTDVSKAFAGAQVTSMKSFVDGINDCLENLYLYLDGKESSFASKFNNVIASYETSDTNVASTYNISQE